MQTNEEHRVTYSAVIENEYHKSLYLMEHNSVALRLLRTLADNCKKFPFFTRTTTNSIKIKIRCCWSAFSMYLKMSPKYQKKVLCNHKTCWQSVFNQNALVQSYIPILVYSFVQCFQWKSEINGPTNTCLLHRKVTASYSTILPGYGRQQLHIVPKGDTNSSITVGIVID